MKFHATYEERPIGKHTYAINGVGLSGIFVSDADYEQYGDNCFYTYETEYQTNDAEQAVLFILEQLSNGEESFDRFDDLNVYGKKRFIEVAKNCGLYSYFDIYEDNED